MTPSKRSKKPKESNLLVMPRADVAEFNESYSIKYANQIQSWLGPMAGRKNIMVISSDEDDSNCV